MTYTRTLTTIDEAPASGLERHDVLGLPRIYPGYTLDLDGGSSWNTILAVTADGSGFALSERTGMIFRFVPLSGKVRRDGLLRVKVYAAVDRGRMDGQLDFSQESGRGVINGNLTRDSIVI